MENVIALVRDSLANLGSRMGTGRRPLTLLRLDMLTDAEIVDACRGA